MISQFGLRCYEFWYAETRYQYHVMAVFVFFGSLLSFWPYLVGYHDTIVERTAMRTNLHSIENIVASTVLLTLTVPLTIDGILDFMVSLLMDRNKVKETTDILNYIERTYIYFGLFIFPLCAFVSEQYVDLGMLALCCSRLQYCLIYGGCFMSVSRIAPHCFSSRLSMLALGAYFIGQKLFTFAYLNIDHLSSQKLKFYYAISNAFNLIAFSMAVMMMMHWIYLNYLKPCFLKRQTPSTNHDHRLSSTGNYNMTDDMLSLKNDIKTRNNMFISIMVVTGIVCLIILLANSQTTVFIDFTPINLVLVHIGLSFFALGLLIYHLRKFRSDALLRLHALVNKKATLLKYVRDLYEPISTIYNAQKHMIKELGEVSECSFTNRLTINIHLPIRLTINHTNSQTMVLLLLWLLLQDVDETVMQSMSDSLDAVNTAAGKLHDLSTQQLQVCIPCFLFD